MKRTINLGVILLVCFHLTAGSTRRYHPYGYDGIMYGPRVLSDHQVPLNAVIYRASIPHHVKRFSWFFRQTRPAFNCPKRHFQVFVQFNKLPLHRLYNKLDAGTIYANISADNMYELHGWVGGGEGKTAWLTVDNPRPGEWFAVVSAQSRPSPNERMMLENMRKNANGAPCQYVYWMTSDIRWQFYHEFNTIPVSSPSSYKISLQETSKLLRFFVFPEMVRVQVQVLNCNPVLPPKSTTTAPSSSTKPASTPPTVQSSSTTASVGTESTLSTITATASTTPNPYTEESNTSEAFNQSVFSNTTGLTESPINASSSETEELGCPLLFRVRGQAFPLATSANYTCDQRFAGNDTCFFDFVPEDTGEYYISVVKTNPNVTVNFTVDVITSECKQGPVAFTQFYANQSASNVSMVECVPIYHIQRHGHAGYGASFSFLRKQYSNQFNILSSGHVIVNNNNRDVLNVKSTPIAYKFVIDPYEDVSGNLIIDLKATEIVRVDIVELIDVCVITKIAPITLDGKIACHGKLHAQINASSSATSSVRWIIPHPEAGDWYIAVWRSCYVTRNSVHFESKCPRAFSGLKSDMAIVQCLNDCGGKGACKFNSNGGVMYGYCACHKGWRGPDCSEFDVGEMRAGMPVLAMLLLTLSNAGFMPAVVLALSRRHYAEALVYTYTMISSAMYHACDSFQDYDPALCVMKLDVLAVADFYGSLYSFWVTLLAVAELNESLKSVCYAGGALFLTVAIQTDRFSVWDFGVPVITGSIIIVLSWMQKCFVGCSCSSTGKRRIAFLVIGVSIAGTALCIYAFAETTENYQYTHSAWHVLISLSLLFLLPPKQQSAPSQRDSADDQGDSKVPMRMRMRKHWSDFKTRVNVRRRQDRNGSRHQVDDTDLLTDENAGNSASMSQHYELLQAGEL